MFDSLKICQLYRNIVAMCRKIRNIFCPRFATLPIRNPLAILPPRILAVISVIFPKYMTALNQKTRIPVTEFTDAMNGASGIWNGKWGMAYRECGMAHRKCGMGNGEWGMNSLTGEMKNRMSFRRGGDASDCGIRGRQLWRPYGAFESYTPLP